MRRERSVRKLLATTLIFGFVAVGCADESGTPGAPEVGPAGRARYRAPRWPDDRGTPAHEGVGARGA